MSAAEAESGIDDAPIAAGQNTAPPVNLLWTGGWDSSFQLLRLLLLYRREVVPHYLVDATRRSTRTELAAMERIRNHLFDRYPHTRQLLMPLRRFDVADLTPDTRIKDAFDCIFAETFIGSQYEWLARFCRQRGIPQLELAAGYREGRIHKIIEAFVAPSDSDGYRTYRFRPECRDTNEFTVFGAFSFPLFELSKLQTAEIAEANGWLDTLKLTSFCHKSRDGEEPCGYCNPCLYAVDEGFGWRIPRRNRIKGVFYRTFIRPMKAPAKAVIRHLGMRAG